jgi:tetratricopeptide (TPR) repeat protein
MSPATPPQPPRKRAYVRAVGPRLRWVLYLVFALFGVLGANSAYLSAITFLEWLHQPTLYQNYFYQVMFGLHLLVGFAFIIPFLIFGAIHLKNSRNRPNRRAVRVGYALFLAGIVILVTGVALTRIDVFQFKNLGLKDPNLRSAAYWAHVITPVLCVWLYILHRLAGPRIHWRFGAIGAAAVAVVVLSMVLLHSLHPGKSQLASKEGRRYFQPSSAKTMSGNFIPAETLMMDDYCKKCHEDVYQGWFHSSHRFSSFNNPFYLFSVNETRQVSLQRDGTVRASRWCAGCHDPVPFFSGAFDDPNFDMLAHPTSQAGITCTSCHAITSVDTPTGNADYTIDEPIHYPFAYSTNRALQWINNQLVKAKPAFHKRVFLKPFMKSEEFCGSCHKVSLPGEVTQYKEWLRGQNHYDTFVLSGAGHGARSFYYPPRAEENCNGCHMPLVPSQDFGANFFNPTNTSQRYVHDHLFASANNALPHLRGDHDIVERHAQFGTNSLRVDIFGIKDGGTIDSPLVAPIRPQVPTLRPGASYLLEVVLRTLRVAHPFSQGTVDSNEIWVDVLARSGNRIVGRSGGLGSHNDVDPWAHFINVYMLDRHGNRIDRRNPQDIFTPLYNNQIPPGAGAVVHYAFTVPHDLDAPLEFEVRLAYRKFDTIYFNYVFGSGYTNGAPLQLTNNLPIRIIARDSVSFPIQNLASSLTPTNPPSTIPPWQRWNDYGIGLLNKGDKGSEKGELIQATQAFQEVENLGRPDGPLNLARVFFKEGRLLEAVDALGRAADTNRFPTPAPRWTRAWLTGLVNKQNGFLDQAIADFTSILEDRYPELDQRRFDFSRDYEILNELGQTLFERAKMERGPSRKSDRERFLREAVRRFDQTLAIDPENVTAHYNLGLIHAQLGDEPRAAEHRRLHEKYRPDDNARDRAVTAARLRDPAADHAAQAIVIYDLQRPGAFELTAPSPAPSPSTPPPPAQVSSPDPAPPARPLAARQP